MRRDTIITKAMTTTTTFHSFVGDRISATMRRVARIYKDHPDFEFSIEASKCAGASWYITVEDRLSNGEYIGFKIRISDHPDRTGSSDYYLSWLDQTYNEVEQSIINFCIMGIVDHTFYGLFGKKLSKHLANMTSEKGRQLELLYKKASVDVMNITTKEFAKELANITALNVWVGKNQNLEFSDYGNFNTFSVNLSKLIYFF